MNDKIFIFQMQNSTLEWRSPMQKFCIGMREAFGDRMRRSVSSRKADKAFDNEKRTLGAMEETDHEEDYQ
jgi:hypothetical protein